MNMGKDPGCAIVLLFIIGIIAFIYGQWIIGLIMVGFAGLFILIMLVDMYLKDQKEKKQQAKIKQIDSIREQEIEERNKINCPACGKKVVSDAVLCPYCGKNFKSCIFCGTQLQKSGNRWYCNYCNRYFD